MYSRNGQKQKIKVEKVKKIRNCCRFYYDFYYDFFGAFIIRVVRVRGYIAKPWWRCMGSILHSRNPEQYWTYLLLLEKFNSIYWVRSQAIWRKCIQQKHQCRLVLTTMLGYRTEVDSWNWINFKFFFHTSREMKKKMSTIFMWEKKLLNYLFSRNWKENDQKWLNSQNRFTMSFSEFFNFLKTTFSGFRVTLPNAV